MTLPIMPHTTAYKWISSTWEALCLMIAEVRNWLSLCVYIVQTYIYIYIYEGNSINKMNFVKGIDNRKQWLWFHLEDSVGHSLLAFAPRTFSLLENQCVFLHQHCPVGWGCRIHWLFLSRGVKPVPQVSWIWN